MKLLNKYKENYLLIGAVISYCTFLIIYFGFFSIEDIFNNPNRLDGTTNFKLFILSALLLAPILEEIVFRGYFTNNKILKLFTIIGLPIFVLSVDKYYLIFTIPYIIVLILLLFYKDKINKHILFISSALVFSVVHYKPEDFGNIITILPILTQFALGLLLIWVVVNFNLRTSILVHFTYNFIVLLPLFFVLQFPDIEQKSIEFNEYKISWQKTPVFSGEFTLLSRPNAYQVNASSIIPLTLYKAYASSKKPNLKDSELFSKYKINIQKLNDSAKELDSTLVKSLLIKANLIIETN